ncbi:MAG: hypothetical protein Q9162_004454 [Coniocarpon cinnabarinum]
MSTHATSGGGHMTMMATMQGSSRLAPVPDRHHATSATPSTDRRHSILSDASTRCSSAARRLSGVFERISADINRSPSQNQAQFENRVNVVLALNHAYKAQLVCLSFEERKLLWQLKRLLAEGPHVFTSLKTYLQHEFETTGRGRMLSTSSSVYSSRNSSRINIKDALKELEMYYWKTQETFLHDYNAQYACNNPWAATKEDDTALEKPRGRSRRCSIKHAISKMGLSDSSAPSTPALPSAESSKPASVRGRSKCRRSRSRSWAPSRLRVMARTPRQDSPAPSVHGPSQYLYDEDARAKLKEYLTGPDKFQEVLDYGFPILPLSEPKESPIIPPPQPSTRGCNPGLDVQRFMRNEVISWLDDEANDCVRNVLTEFPDELDSPMSESERAVDQFARELVNQKEIQSKDELLLIENSPTGMGTFDCDFDLDISDFEHAVDDSQDDRRSPSPVSPVTPTTPDAIPLPISQPNSLARHTPSSSTCTQADSLQTLQNAPAKVTTTPPKGPPSHGLEGLIRTAPALTDGEGLYISPRPHHAHSQSMPMMKASGHSRSKSQRLSTEDRTHASPSHPSKSFHTRGRSEFSKSGKNSRTSSDSIRRKSSGLSRSKSKPLPMLPRERSEAWSLVPPVELPTPQDSVHTAKERKYVPQKHSFDSPAAYMTPRDSPQIDATPPRQMTLRMTLTRPELRASDEEIYGHRRTASSSASMLRPSTSSFAGGPSVMPHSPSKLSTCFADSAPHFDPIGHPIPPIPAKPVTRRRSELHIVNSPSPALHKKNHSDPSARQIVHPDLPPNVQMHSRDVARTETMPQLPKRTPNKLRKARTDPVRRLSPVDESTPRVAMSEALYARPYDSYGLSAVGEKEEQIEDGFTPDPAINTSGAGKKSLWKKMSMAGFRERPKVVLP